MGGVSVGTLYSFPRRPPGISPMEMRKAGAVLENMSKAGYSKKDSHTLCRALFCEQSEKQLRRAFRFYDTDGSGFLDAVEFRVALPLMGEDVSEERINELFRKVAVDESGCIDFDGFCRLVKAMNPKRNKEIARQSDPVAVLRDAVGRVSRTWTAKTKDLQVAEESFEHRKSHRRKKDGTSGGSPASSSAAGMSMGLPPVVPMGLLG